jgi:hypothetical protein
MILTRIVKPRETGVVTHSNDERATLGGGDNSRAQQANEKQKHAYGDVNLLSFFGSLCE